MLTLPTPALKDMLDELLATGKFLDALTLHLYQNNVPLSRRTVLADLDTCDFDGYAAVTPLVWGTDWRDSAGNWGVQAVSVQFDCTTAVKPQDVYGYYVTRVVSAVPTLCFAEAFTDGPYPARLAGQSVLVAPRFSLYDLAAAITAQL